MAIYWYSIYPLEARGVDPVSGQYYRAQTREERTWYSGGMRRSMDTVSYYVVDETTIETVRTPRSIFDNQPFPPEHFLRPGQRWEDLPCTGGEEAETEEPQNATSSAPATTTTLPDGEYTVAGYTVDIRDDPDWGGRGVFDGCIPLRGWHGGHVPATLAELEAAVRDFLAEE